MVEQGISSAGTDADDIIKMLVGSLPTEFSLDNIETSKDKDKVAEEVVFRKVKYEIEYMELRKLGTKASAIDAANAVNVQKVSTDDYARKKKMAVCMVLLAADAAMSAAKQADDAEQRSRSQTLLVIPYWKQLRMH